MGEFLFLDGAFGTMAQNAGLLPGEDPFEWNAKNPQGVEAIHKSYVEAGADVVLANTFGANPLKYRGKNNLSELVKAAIRTAKLSNAKRVAIDIGPSGRLLKPAGDLSFKEAFEAFSVTVKAGVEAGADLAFVETMGDTRELKAAILAVKENSNLPIYATVSLDENGKLLTGADVECVSVLLESLDVDAYGFNCGLGPDKMEEFVRFLRAFSSKRIIVKPNAGMPRMEGGRTVFSQGPEEFAKLVLRLVDAGASIVGGCCGTTPEHIKAVKNLLEGKTAEKKNFKRSECVVSSGTSVVKLKPYSALVIGERINPTGKKALKEAYKRGDTAYVLREAVKQIDDGAEILDINCGVPGIDESSTLEGVVESVQSVVSSPLQIDTANAEALGRALFIVNGKALVNSVNGKQESMDGVFPLVKRYGGTVVALCLDENGIPSTSQGRIDIARRILDEGAKYGLKKKDFVFDALTLAVSADPTAAVVTLETVKRLTEELGVNTVLGVSNVSFGLPNRPALNNAMYALAKRAGLSAAIANPSLIREEVSDLALDVLLGRDEGCQAWIDACSGGCETSQSLPPQSAGDAPTFETLMRAIEKGLLGDAKQVAAQLLLIGTEPLKIIGEGIVPALENVGLRFEKGEAFLPQLLMAADAAGAAFGEVRKSLKTVEGEASSEKRRAHPIVIATVKGDIHDIGKNIVRALLENYGFDVIDLGRDVEPEKIVETALSSGAFMIGLSALMTTTVGAMGETICLAKERGVKAKFCVGGAVLTQEYASSIGADYYAKDAMRTVRIAEELGDMS
ncbi:MAG: homocysteine S-methyltransferase family protein [Kiritimatiellae bacterium]|nr:homocysteine S-methyltransferase family protein [Kiritimatiellia bacterium]